ncbi:PepSY domain-containing protein [uncultured Tateyamaria sp.]|uniref:PepSY domain-containing protein n=1 Tax=uncultured Tateyamaria sp. TaxID=455651 RepID=UPI00261D4240|nr:PepSY domain-containing protein [uncultured Tateyamaria sp.]
MTYMTKTTVLAALIVPGFALAGLSTGNQLGTTEADIRAALTAMGYDVQEIEIEDDEIEAEVTLDGVEYEIEVALDTGKVIEIETEDDDDDTDD